MGGPSVVGGPPTGASTLGSIPSLGNQSSLGNQGSDLSQGLVILDRVRRKQISVEQARRQLAHFTEEEKGQLAQSILDLHAREGGPPPTDAMKALHISTQDWMKREFAAGKGYRAEVGRGSGLAATGVHLGTDVGEMVSGLLPGVGLTGRAVGQDVYDMFAHPGKSMDQPFHHIGSEIAKPMAKQLAWQYGPLLQGHPGEFAARVGEHPLGPLLDALSVVSAGVGTAGRVANTARVMKAAEVTRSAQGTAVVGGRFYVNQLANGKWYGRDSTTGRRITSPTFPDEKSAVMHVQSMATGGVSGGTFKQVLGGMTKKGPKGSLIDLYDKVLNVNHSKELDELGKIFMETINDPNLQLNRRTWAQVKADLRKDWTMTREAGKQKPGKYAHNLPGFMGAEGLAIGTRALGVAATTVREMSDLVRAGAIYLRGAYLPNNWVGNEFMNLTQQGVFAPLHLAKSLGMDKHLGKRNTKALDAIMGMNPTEALMGKGGTGYIASLSATPAKIMGSIADQPFRRAALLHELRRMGYRKLSDVKQLVETASMSSTSRTGERALRDLSEAARRASEEIGKFGHMNDVERQVLRNLIFVYSWMRAAGRYSMRFPFQHPIQAAVQQYTAQVGSDWMKSEMGGVPSFLVGAVPVGHDDKGNPILINPLALNPLGTGLDIGRAVAGTAEIIGGSRDFNKYAQKDLVSLFNPIAGAYLEGREGGTPFLEAQKKTIAGYNLVQDLKHPGSGSVYPTTRGEAVGRFLGGGLYPRQADQAAITRALEREKRLDPAALIPAQVEQFEKAFKSKIPPQMIGEYKADLEMIEELRDFQEKYAQRHGSSGFRNMPPANKLEAAIDFVEHYTSMPSQDITGLKQAAETLTTDASKNEFANSIFAMTGIGTMKRQWDELMHDVRGMRLTRKRK
jgi:hypothetical protein